MHPVFIIIIIASAVWYYAVGSMTRKSAAGKAGLALLGAVLFLVVSILIEQIVKDQDFFRRALRSGPDMGAILTYITFPAIVVVFLIGLWLKTILGKKPSSLINQEIPSDNPESRE